jgi:hypothetical protein
VSVQADLAPDAGADTRGLVTLAAGDARYLEMAVDLALSARAHAPLPFALVADPTLGRLARERYAGVFAEVRGLPERFREGRARKYGVPQATPWDRAIFIDADCLLLGPLDRYWEALGDTDFALVGERLGLEDDVVHHGFSTRELIARFDLPWYLKSNSGVFYFRRGPALEIMDDCLACHRDEIHGRLRGGFLGDELAFGLVGGRRGLSIFPSPGPMYWPNEFPKLDLGRPKHPVLHFLAPLAPDTLRTLIGEADRRRREAGVPGSAAPHWTVEQRRVGRTRRLDRLVRPLLPLARLLGLQARASRLPGRDGLAELGAVQAGELAALRQQVVPRTALDDPPRT